MYERLSNAGAIIGLLMAGLTGNALAENPQIALSDPFVLKGQIKVEVGQPTESLMPLIPVRQIEIDNQIRTIGGATSWPKKDLKQLPAQKFPFFINPADIKDKPQLTIGYVRGINTPEAHAAGQSNTGHISSPAVIKVNGIRVQYLYTDEELVSIKIPLSLLKPDGFNVLQVEAGFYFLPGNQVAYDQIELQHLALRY